MRRMMIIIAVVVLCGLRTAGQELATGDPNRWEPEIQQFEAADKIHPPPKGLPVFVGASSIVRWNLEEWFPDMEALNRGFGGSEMADSAKYASRIVVPYQPRVVVLYPGENDLARGATPRTIGLGFERFTTTILDAKPDTRIVVIGLKPTPARWELTEKMHQANKLLKSQCDKLKGCTYINVWPSMLGPGGKPRAELFVADGQHMSPEGYRIWTRLVKPYLK